MTVTGFWFAIEDATLENGCLWAKPAGTARSLRKVFKRAGDSRCRRHRLRRARSGAIAVAGASSCRSSVPAGTMVVLHGLLPHWSDINRSPTSRHAYSLHCIPPSADYPEWNWLQRPRRHAAAVAGRGVAGQ